MSLLPFDPDVANTLCSELDRWHEQFRWRDWHGHGWTGRLRRDVEAETVAASTRMEGVNVTVDEVRRILAGDKPPQVTQEDADLVTGYREAMRFALARADDPTFRWTSDLLIAIQDRAAAGRADMGAGRFARTNRTLRDRTTGALVFSPPEWEDIPALVDEMCQHLNNEDMHPAVSAAWAHIATAAIHPFQDGNGRTARIAASLAMFRAGYRHWTFTTLESWWGSHTSDYHAAFSCLGSAFSRNADVTSFIEIHTQAQLTQVRSLDLREKVEHRVHAAISEVIANLHLDPRLVDAVWDAFWNRDVTAGYYRSLTEVSPATATNDLAAASAAGLLTPVGARRGRRYKRGARVTEAVADILEIPLSGESNPVETIVGVLAERQAQT